MMAENRGQGRSMRTEILYEDGDILVIYKPAGLATQTAKTGQQDVISELKNYLWQQSQYSPVPSHGKDALYLGVIHRLDQPVEGILVFAKNKKAAAFLAGQVQKQGDGEMLCKRYYAVFCGNPGVTEGDLTDYLYKNRENRAVVIEAPQCGAQGVFRDTETLRGESCGVFEDTETFRREEQGVSEDAKTLRREDRKMSGDAKTLRHESQSASEDAGMPTIRRAELHYRILEMQEERGIGMAEIRLGTGRFHQIRAQMAHAGMPLLGDMKYGDENSSRISKALEIRNVALCACDLEFIHPVSREKLHFQIKPRGRAFSFFHSQKLS